MRQLKLDKEKYKKFYLHVNYDNNGEPTNLNLAYDINIIEDEFNELFEVNIPYKDNKK